MSFVQRQAEKRLPASTYTGLITPLRWSIGAKQATIKSSARALSQPPALKPRTPSKQHI
jgi:hypothetical protein